jgi:hypothetical protein
MNLSELTLEELQQLFEANKRRLDRTNWLTQIGIEIMKRIIFSK